MCDQRVHLLDHGGVKHFILYIADFGHFWPQPWVSGVKKFIWWIRCGRDIKQFICSTMGGCVYYRPTI